MAKLTHMLDCLGLDLTVHMVISSMVSQRETKPRPSGPETSTLDLFRLDQRTIIGRPILS